MVHFVSETLLLAVDLGMDAVVAYTLDPAAGRLQPAAAPITYLPAGFGPRHLVALPDDLVAIVGELTGEIALARLNPTTGELDVLDVIAGTDTEEPPSWPSGIGRTADGRYRGDGQPGTEHGGQLPGAAGADAEPRAGRRDRLRRRHSPGSDGRRRLGVRGQPGKRHGDRARPRSRDRRAAQPPRAGSRCPAPPRCSRWPAAATGRDAMTDYRIVRLQVQRGPVKIGKAPLRWYEPAAHRAGDHAAGRAAGRPGRHRRRRGGPRRAPSGPSRSRGTARAGPGSCSWAPATTSPCASGTATTCVDGIAGETVLLDAPDGLAGGGLPPTVTVLTAGGPLELHGVRTAAPVRRVQPVLPASGAVAGGRRRRQDRR